ncbi:MAG: tail fiber domain-containing protein [Spirochaetota bacterium]
MKNNLNGMNDIASRTFYMKGFTLMELLLYTGISVIIGGMAVGALLTVTKINQNASATAEVSGQMNFVLQRIQQLVSESSNIDIDAGVTISSVKLRMQDSAKDPTCISLIGGVIKLAEGPGDNPNDCTTATSDLTSDRVIVNTFNFKKYTQYPGHDTVSLDMTMAYNSDNPDSQVSRSLSSAIGRVSAATFDANVLPGDTSYTIGQSSLPWQNVFVADGSAASPSYSFGNGTNTGLFKVSGTSTIGFATAGTERMRIDANGNVGIGTTSPLAKLAIKGTSTGTGRLLQITDSNNVEKVTILDNGNVGIGTTEPGLKLTIQGAAAGGEDNLIRLIEDGGGAEYFDIGMRNLGNIFFANDNGIDVLTLLDGTDGGVIINGNVGIGTTTPAYKIHAVTSTTGWGYFFQNTAGTNNYIYMNNSVYGVHIRNDSAPAGNYLLDVYPSNSLRFQVMGDGKVNVGSTLTVGGLVNAANYLQINSKYAIDGTDSYLRLNAQNSFTSGIYTPYAFRATGIIYTDTSFRMIGDVYTIQDSNQFYCNNAASCYYNYNGTGPTIIGNSVATTINTRLNSGGPAFKPGGGPWADLSDERLKKNIQPIENALDKITQLRGVSFEWINPDEHGNLKNPGGFIAQEVEQFFPEWVSESDLEEGKDKPLLPEGEKVKNLNFSDSFFAYIIEAIKELNARTIGVISAISSKLADKNNVKNLSASVAKNDILNLRPVSFNWVKEIDPNQSKDIGLIAEEVAKIIPDLVTYDASGNPEGVKYEKIGIYALIVLQEQQKQIDQLKTENDALKGRIEILEKR